MKSETVLDLVVFQLTPTRTRCELVIKANGKTEKIASGLLNPFLSHLKTAKDQIAKGGYSITLEPDPGVDTAWFTKGTVERFVRFVSTPEVLERVNTVELEITQMEEAIAMQANEILHASPVEEDVSKSAEYSTGSKTAIDADATGKSIVLYKPGNGTPSPDSSGEKTTSREENSKVQLLRVLENRKTVLQKEQGMAFARAMAAGFTVDNISHLISFAECFGAARLLEACSKFMELYHGKHETGQWLEIDAADAMSLRSDFAAMNLSGITLSADISRQQGEHANYSSDISNGKVNGADINPDLSRDTRMNGGVPRTSVGPAEGFQGQYAHPMYHQWPVHSPPGMYQPYPVQGMPFYPSYPPYFAPPYAPSEDPAHRKPKKSKPKKRYGENKSASVEDSESNEASPQSRDDDDDDDDEDEDNVPDVQKEDFPKKESRRKSGRSGGKKSGMVVIKNLNYITSKKHKDDGSSSASEDSESRRSSKHSKAKGGSSSTRGIRADVTEEDSLPNNGEAAAYGQELVDSGNWQVFQSFLLRQEEDEENREKGRASADAGMFSGEKKPATRKPRGGEVGDDPLLSVDRDYEESTVERKVAEDFDGGSSGAKMYTHKGLNDDKFHYQSSGGSSMYLDRDVPLEEIEGGGRRGGYRRGTSEDFLVYGGDKQFPSARHSSDPIAENEFDLPAPIPKASGNGSSSPFEAKVVGDESFIVPVRLGSPEQNKGPVVMDLDFPPPSNTTQELDSVVKIQVNYEPEDLSLMMPERDSDGDLMFQGGGYDPVLDYGMEGQVETSDAQVEESAAETKEETNREKKARAAPQKKADPGFGRSRLSKPTLSAQAQARADKLRAYKADLQKAKKEKEDETIRRLEALKLERQKRIAARSSGNSAAPPPSTTQDRKTTQTRASNVQRTSKFSDAPGAPSLLQRRLPLPLRASPVGSDSRKQSAASAVSRSVSSLSNNAKKDAAQVAVLSRSDLKKGAPPPPNPIGNDGVTATRKKSEAARSLTSKSTGTEDSRLKESERKGNDDLAEVKSKDDKEKLVQRTGGGDENAVVEKIVVMLERETPSALERKDAEIKLSAGRPEMISTYAAVRAPPAPVVKCEAVPKDSGHVVIFSSPVDQPEAESCEMPTPNKLSSIAPEAAALSEEPLIGNLNRPAASREISPTRSGGDDLVVVEEELRERVEKSRNRESLKGFKKLLKFGRKSHHGSSSATADDDDEPSSAGQGTAPTVGFPGDMIIRAEAIAELEDTPPKSSDKSGTRHFSILSSFRSKNSEKSKPSPA